MAIEVSAEKIELLIRKAYVLNNSILKETRNGGKAL
jgi:hypothetical protein